MPRLAATGLVAVDTEAASFHKYLDRVYLLQLSSREETVVVDPLAVKDVSAFAFSLSATSSFRTLSRSASRIASMNWPWNSAAMRRILPMVWPIVRMTRGNSFETGLGCRVAPSSQD